MRGGAAADDRLSPAEISAAIEETRQRLSRTLARLDRDYALRHLVVRGERALRGAGDSRDGDSHAIAFHDALRRNAAPMSLIALGLAWLALTEHRSAVALAQQFAPALARLQQVASALLPARAPRDAAP